MFSKILVVLLLALLLSVQGFRSRMRDEVSNREAKENACTFGCQVSKIVGSKTYER